MQEALEPKKKKSQLCWNITVVPLISLLQIKGTILSSLNVQTNQFCVFIQDIIDKVPFSSPFSLTSFCLENVALDTSCQTAAVRQSIPFPNNQWGENEKLKEQLTYVGYLLSHYSRNSHFSFADCKSRWQSADKALHTWLVKLDSSWLGISCAILVQCPVVACVSLKGIFFNFSQHPHICNFPGICHYLPSPKICPQFDAFDSLLKTPSLPSFLNVLHISPWLYFTLLPQDSLCTFPCSIYCTVQYQPLLVQTIIPSFLKGASFQLWGL